MEVKREEVTAEKYQEMEEIARKNVCAECGADLQIYTVPERKALAVGCLVRTHTGWIEKETWTEMHRRGVEVHPAIRDNIEHQELPKEELGRAMQLLALRYPAAIQGEATAALFIMDCYRLDLDPLISPPEAVPAVFKSKVKVKDGKIEEKVAVVMIVTADGWLSMAARGCKDDWVGPPKTMRLEEYLAAQPEHAGKTREELAAIAGDIKKSDCGDEEAWAYVAIGRRRGGDETAVLGFFTRKDKSWAAEKKLPAAAAPGNQARMRAIKKWARQVFPEARQRMLTLSEEWYRRSAGVQEAQHYIDVEYRILETRGDEEIGGRTEEEGGGGGKQTAPTISESQKGKGKKKPGGAPAAAGEPEYIVGDGFSIEIDWLNKSLKTLNWSEVSTRTFLTSHYQVDGSGSIPDILKRLTRAQAEDFTKEIDQRLENQPRLM